jgi:hypothetical protein
VRHREEVENLSRKLADEGRLVEAGWLSFRASVVAAQAPEDQLREMRIAFFAGAQHLFGSIMTILDPDDEPTAADLKRLDDINDELNDFLADIMKAMTHSTKPK